MLRLWLLCISAVLLIVASVPASIGPALMIGLVLGFTAGVTIERLAHNTGSSDPPPSPSR